MSGIFRINRYPYQRRLFRWQQMGVLYVLATCLMAFLARQTAALSSHTSHAPSSSRPTCRSLVGRTDDSRQRRSRLVQMMRVRGGAEGDSDFDAEDDFGDSLVEADFESDNSVQSKLLDLLKAFDRTPPITKGYLLTSAFLTGGAYFLTAKKVFPRELMYDWKKVLQGQIWRLMTGFFYIGDFGLSYLMTAQFIWTYMANLEKLNYKHPEQFAILLLFGMACLTLAYPLLNAMDPTWALVPEMLGHNLSSFIVYVWSRTHEGQDVNIMDLFQLRAEYLPWFFVMQTWLLEGQAPTFDLLGIAFGWLYHWLKSRHWLKSPPPLKDLFRQPVLKRQYEKYEKEFE
ncbi:unnamed protein product [Vitrella brassicaformis CCMP3155]|uniref:Derlin n=2 Tax=Vitrella brassicaformis TaxID=1169539 RepID=A0A0G4GDN6_VITBC|nr:unnamed protein product [Vitrella brassicaformis CCMP3155]|mmetsp:Transcript_45088/g.112005  ORF Transcript_45088/g.112005 Transcript_45088/m.112005 type:complete len:343 (+) Transcript_45088:115-1143(+)|eukprot:CEM27117.1 unnamed protein product [Vitrella brassicaformis CCMP3155]